MDGEWILMTKIDLFLPEVLSLELNFFTISLAILYIMRACILCWYQSFIH